MTGKTSTVSSLIIAVMTGAIPNFSPLDLLYGTLFNEQLPDYLYVGFSSIGTFSLFYSLILVMLVTPLACAVGFTTNKLSTRLDKPSYEDLLYLPLIYIVYIGMVYVNGYLTITTALVGIVAIMIPMIYRIVVYILDELVSNGCYAPFELFVISFICSVLISVPYLYIVRFILSFF